MEWIIQFDIYRNMHIFPWWNQKHETCHSFLGMCNGTNLFNSCWVSGVRLGIEFLEQSCRISGIKWITMTFLDFWRLNQTVISLRVRTSHGVFTALSPRSGKMLASSTGLFIRLIYGIGNQGHPQKKKDNIHEEKDKVCEKYWPSLPRKNQYIVGLTYTLFMIYYNFLNTLNI